MKTTHVNALAAVGLLAPTVLTMAHNMRSNETMIYSYDDIQPSQNIEWTPCYDNFTCTLLEVPLDYTDDSVGTTGIAFIKYSSSNESAEDLLFNPGGPGDSGVNFILDNAEQLYPLYGKNFNFVSFDPRGVNNSRAGLSLECFPGNAQARRAWNGEYFRKPVDTSSSISMYEGWAKAGGWGELCTTVGAADSKRRYANTVAAAHDMLRYVEILAQSRGQAAAEAKLWYYGLSYGTALGTTFATLFPDRIARMVLDGVVNSDQYYGGRWEDLLTDGDAAVRDFFVSCYKAGPEICVFCGNASSAADVEARFFRIYNDLKENPIIISDPSITSIPTILGAGDLKAALFLATYSPFGDYPLMAAMLAELEVGNATILASRSGLPTRQSPIEPKDNTYVADSVRTQILCLDANGRAGISTQEQFEEHADLMHDLSFFGGEYFSVIMGVACRSYEIRPPPSQVFSGIAGANDTSSPILFVGNTRDPVAPLAAAKLMSGRFPGSSVLELKATAHTSLPAISTCMIRHVQAYLANTTLPVDGATCEIDTPPFTVGE